MKKLLLHCAKLVLVSCLLVGLTACHKHARNNGMGEEGAQAYGYDDQQGYLDGTRRHVNALTAPSNQVYYFDFDQSSARQEDMEAINIQASYLATHANARVRLEGNTDNRGSREYNVGLGWHRAQAIAAILKQQGVSPKQIVMISYGKEHPVAMGDNEQSWELNRRVELIYEAQ